MELSKIIEQVNYLIDDSLPSEQITAWVNDALAEIGVVVNAVFPEADVTDSAKELPIPTKYQRLLVIPYASAKAKQQDSSQFEYQDLYSQFENNLAEFQMSYVVPKKYKELQAEQEIIFSDATTYETVTGDTLYQIALDNATTVETLLANNEEVKYLEDGLNSDIYENPTFVWGSGW